jgi:hypothetical protein
LTIAQARFNDAKENQDAILARLQISEERLQNSLRVGSVSELEALHRTSALRKEAVAQLDTQVTALEEVARASNNPKLILQAEQARAALEKLRLETELLADKFNTIFNDSFSDAFADFITGTKSASDAFKSFTNSVLREINKIVAQDIAKRIFGSTGSSGGTSGGGGIGGLIVAGISALAGGTSYADIVSSNPVLGTNLSLDQYADGTNYVPKTGLYTLHQGEAVVPAAQNQSMGTYSPTFNIPASVDKRTIAQIEAAAYAGARRSYSRNS